MWHGGSAGASSSAHSKHAPCAMQSRMLQGLASLTQQHNRPILFNALEMLLASCWMEMIFAPGTKANLGRFSPSHIAC